VKEEFSVAGLQVTVAGAGRSGVAAARLLASRGARVTLSEERTAFADAPALRAAGVMLELGGNRVESFARADLVVLSPGVPLEQPFVAAARKAGVPVIGEIELASRWLRGRVIAVTGTKGKSTTTTLTGRMLAGSGVRAAVGGNIGVPLSAQVGDSTADTVHVVEVSSFQLESIDRFHPWIAALLNFSPDHLDRHPDVAVYASAKGRIFENQSAHDWAVVGADDPEVVRLASAARSRRRWFGLQSVDEGVTVDAGMVVERVAGRTEALVPVAALQVPGRHILSDVLAATAISRLAGATPAAIAGAVESFRGLEHAMELAGEVAGVGFVNDSKATNVAAARHAIESVAGHLVVIMGGRYKGGDFRDLRAAVAGRAGAIVTIGEAADLVDEALGDLVRIERARSMDEAVQVAFTAARPAGTVVLAPACASFDMFTDYAERGRVFKEAVARLAGEWRAADEQ
jgi:UDP-N-acetylmuramoylalanine--D-glutamate ligase